MQARSKETARNCRKLLEKYSHENPKRGLVFWLFLDASSGEENSELTIRYFKDCIDSKSFSESKKEILIFKALKYISQMPQNITFENHIRLISKTFYSLSRALSEIKHSARALELIAPLFSSVFVLLFNFSHKTMSFFYLIRAALYNPEFLSLESQFLSFPNQLIDDVIDLKSKTIDKLLAIIHEVQVHAYKHRVDEDPMLINSFYFILEKSIRKIEGDFNFYFSEFEAELLRGFFTLDEVKKLKDVYLTRVEVKNQMSETSAVSNHVKITKQCEEYIETHRISEQNIRQIKHTINLIESSIKKMTRDIETYSTPDALLQKSMTGSEIQVILVGEIPKPQGVLRLINQNLTKSKNLNCSSIDVDDEKYLRIVTERPNMFVMISINNMVTYYTSLLVHKFMSLDRRAEQLHMFIQAWGIQNGIIDIDSGKLSEIHMALMVISFLQKENVLPFSIQNSFHEPRIVEGFDTWFDDEFQFRSYNDSSLGKLVKGFLKWYGQEFYDDQFSRICDIKNGQIQPSDLRVLFPVLHPFTGEIVQKNIVLGTQESIEIVEKFREKLAHIERIGSMD